MSTLTPLHRRPTTLVEIVAPLLAGVTLYCGFKAARSAANAFVGSVQAPALAVVSAGLLVAGTFWLVVKLYETVFTISQARISEIPLRYHNLIMGLLIVRCTSLTLSSAAHLSGISRGSWAFVQAMVCWIVYDQVKERLVRTTA